MEADLLALYIAVLLDILLGTLEDNLALVLAGLFCLSVEFMYCRNE